MARHPEATIRVLIADDQPLFAETLGYVLKAVKVGIDVTGIAADGEQALEMVDKYLPDIVLMDVRMPSIDGVEATKLIHRKHPSVKIIMLTTFDDDEYVYFAVKYGAVGYLLKNIRPQDLINAIQTVMGGATLFSRGISTKALKASGEEAGDIDQTIAGLTPREKDVLNLVMQLKSNRQIADRLSLSEQTVRNYIHSLYDAFEVPDRLELIQRLQELWPMTR